MAGAGASILSVKKTRRNYWVAPKALANKLCRAGYYMMRDQTEFGSALLFG
jgi:hypothetical protein